MRIGAVDVETYDPYIKLGLGAGWPYKLHVPQSRFKVLGVGYYLPDTGESEYLVDGTGIEKIISQLDAVVFHNGQYDAGALYTLGIDISDKVIYDTKIIANLYDNTLASLTLDYLTKKFLSPEYWKNKHILYDAVKEAGLVPLPKRQNYNKKRYQKLIKNYCNEHMDVLQERFPEIIANYCKQDCKGSYGLFRFFTE